MRRRKNIMIKKLITLGIASLMTVMSMLVPSFAGEVLLKLPTWFGTHLPSLGTSPLFIESNINAIGPGLGLKVKLYEPGKLVPSKGMLEAVSKGQINSGYTTPGYNMGILGSKGSIFSAVPFGPDAPEFLAWIYYGNGRTLWQKMYDDAGFNVHQLPCGIIAPETSGWFKTEIKKPSDLKGMRMRFFGLGANVMEKMGVSTSLLGAKEILPNIEKGAIDATEFSMPVIDKLLGFHKILKFNYFPGWHQPATTFELLINKDTWNNEMDGAQRALVELTCKAVMTDGLAMGEALQADAMKHHAEMGVNNKYWRPKMLEAFEAAWNEVIVEESAKDPQFKVIFDDLSAFRANYAIWNEWAYLPRPGTKRIKSR
jgi:TRAP-type mannitol/chloroaromatic compound transport system substrate-binding protein